MSYTFPDLTYGVLTGARPRAGRYILDTAIMARVDCSLDALQKMRQTLGGAGFTFHTSDEDTTDAALIGKHWWCWCGPEGKWGVESGEPQDDPAMAVYSAFTHWTQYMTDARRNLSDALHGRSRPDDTIDLAEWIAPEAA